MEILIIVSMGDTMKKLIIIFMTLLLLVSCAKSEAPKKETEPKPFTFPMTVEAHLSCDAGNARVVIEYESAERYTLRYTEPAVMTGITYGIDGEGTYMTFGQSRIPVSDGEACFASLAVGRLLCPRAEDTVNTEFENGLPVRAEGTIDGFKATLAEIKIEYNSQG